MSSMKDLEEKYLNIFFHRFDTLEGNGPELLIKWEKGEIALLDKQILPVLFDAPEVLVGFYVHRRCNCFDIGYSLFMKEYSGWIDEYKVIAGQAKDVFENELRDCIQDYFEDNLKAFELEGVELCEEDVEWTLQKIKDGTSFEKACDECLQGIRDCLDEGLDDINEYDD